MPKTYSEEQYCRWHEHKFPGDAPLAKKVEEFRDNLKAASRQSVEALYHLLAYIGNRAESEVQTQGRGLAEGRFDIKLPVSSAEHDYDKAFKPTSSVINKMWRKNVARSKDYLSIAGLPNEVSDLVRTSVVGPSHFACRLFAERIPGWKSNLQREGPEELLRVLDPIENVAVESEAKLASGYFAYHAAVGFRGGLKVEVQIYSRLTEAWRHLSHRLYERTRSGEKVSDHPESPEVRLTSLGHLLNLAERELVRLLEELK